MILSYKSPPSATPFHPITREIILADWNGFCMFRDAGIGVTGFEIAHNEVANLWKLKLTSD
jgi:hypothetical protein